MANVIDVVVVLLGAWAAAAETPHADLGPLRETGVPTDGTALIAWLRPRLPAAGDDQRAAALVSQLGDRKFEVRNRATNELIALGPKAAARLEAALRDPGAEVRNRARHCLRAIAILNPVWPNIVLRLQEEHPPGTTAALLALLPLLDDDAEECVHVALHKLSRQGGRLEPELLAALADESPARRAAAALVVGRSRLEGVRNWIRPLLKDSDPKVRLFAAMGLLAAGDRLALHSLPDLVEVPGAAERTESVLATLAVNDVPAVTAATTLAERRQAWAVFVRDHAQEIDLAPLESVLPGQNITLRAKRVAERFIACWQRNNGRGLLDSSSAPFWSAGKLLATPADLTRSWGPMSPGGANAYHFRFHQLLPTAKALPFCQGQSEIAYFKGLRPADHRVMVYSPTPNSWGLIIIRVHGGKVTVAGLTVDRGGEPPK
ncbi:MAG: HEAT repeat domain-containing protein [Gemmataceae bacterium]